MRVWISLAVAAAITCLLVGCTAKEQPKEVSTVSTAGLNSRQEVWAGPVENAVGSSDSAHCSQSVASAKRGMPGFLSYGHTVFHSTERVVPLTPDLVDTGYHVRDLTLWRNPVTDREMYIAVTENNAPPQEAVIYAWGGCE